MEKGSLRRADMMMSIILMFYSLGMLFFAIKLQLRTLSKGKDWYQSAGLFPIIVSVLLLLCAIMLFLRARKDGALFDFINMEKVITLVKSREFYSAAIVIGLLAVYIFVLLPTKWIRYEASTFIFLFVFMMIFNDRTLKKIMVTLVISVLATAIITYGFGTLAMIPLP